MKGVIFYEAGILSFFPSPTIVDPVKWMKILHSHLQREAYKSRYKIEGQMPDDFYEKMELAITQSDVLEPKTKKYLLWCISKGER